MIVIDTSTLVDIERDAIPNTAKQHLQNKTIAITSLTYAEYWYGLLPNPKAELVTRLQEYKVIQTTRKSAELFAEYKQRLQDTGGPIPDFDLFIATITISHNASLLTRDKHFQQIDDLKTITY